MSNLVYQLNRYIFLNLSNNLNDSRDQFKTLTYNDSSNLPVETLLQKSPAKKSNYIFLIKASL